MLFYIDYLDHLTSGTKYFKVLELQLRFDLLIFGCDTLCMSVPACVKLRETTELLIKLDQFWRSGKILLQLDGRHNGNPANYFINRKKVLSKGMPEEQLTHHFEFLAYEHERTNRFFNTYLPQIANASPSNIFLGKEKDTDKLFRNETIDLFHKNYDIICKALEPVRAIKFTGITNRIHSYALDRSMLFQRAVIEENIRHEFTPNNDELLVIATLLDRSFAVANAATSNAIPLSLVRNQLTGKWLARLLRKSYGSLYNLICELSWDDVYTLSQDDDWRRFIGFINAYIGLIQDSNYKKYAILIDACISKLSHMISLFLLLRFAKEEALAAAKDKLFEFGLFSEAQNMEVMATLVLECYNGKYKVLYDSMRAIDLYTNRIIEKLTIEKDLEYLLSIAAKQKEKGYEILR